MIKALLFGSRLHGSGRVIDAGHYAVLAAALWAASVSWLGVPLLVLAIMIFVPRDRRCIQV